jgi:hypothetical protein
MNKSQDGFSHVLLVLIVAIVLVIICGLYFLQYKTDHNRKVVKQELTQELAKYPTPKGCTETSRNYKISDIDNPSAWNIAYHCDPLDGSTYNTIVQQLQKDGYKIGVDHTNAGTSQLNGALMLDKGNFHPIYSFLRDSSYSNLTLWLRHLTSYSH